MPQNTSMAWLTNLYRALWLHTGGRPWTYIMRDFAYQNPMLMLIVGINIGFWCSHWMRVIGIVYFASGLLLGHLFWGTRYIPNQGGSK